MQSDLLLLGARADLISGYGGSLSASGALERFAQDPCFENAEALALARLDAVHDSAPEGAAMAIMFSGGKDSSAVLHYYVESVLARIDAGKRFVPARVIAASTGHEFPAMARRLDAEIAAINKWGTAYGISAEVVSPHPRNTLMVELLGNGMALPPRAMNDRVAAASIANWCVMRVKRDLLQAAVKRASGIAPVVIQALGSRPEESASRAYTVKKYGEGLPDGLTRVGGESDGARCIGLNVVEHFTGKHIRDFVHLRMPAYRPLGNLELEQIYREMSGPAGGEATECSIQRTADGGFGGGCANLLTGTRAGCAICFKSVNRALLNLSVANPRRYSMLYRLQEAINRHQDLVHARPKAVKAAGFAEGEFFPKGFTFTERYKMLVMLLAAEIESGDTHLSSEQIDWIERRWRRHGVFTVCVEDARRDAVAWLEAGAIGEPVPFFAAFAEMSGEFTEALGEGMSLGAFAAFSDPEQEDLNLAHLLALRVTGTPPFPRVLSYVFRDFADPDRLIVGVTDEPAVLGARTSTGLLNGMSGATWRCIGVRAPTRAELAMADGRHMFYLVRRSDVARYTEAIRSTTIEGAQADWLLGDFLTPRRMTGLRLADFRREWSATMLAAFDVALAANCGLDAEPLSVAHRQQAGISEMRGRHTRASFQALFEAVTRLLRVSEALSETTVSVQSGLLDDLESLVAGDWGLLSAQSDAGKELRKQIRGRLRRSIFGSEVAAADYREYLDALKAVAQFYRDGTVNTALVTRLAYAVRVSDIHEGDGEQEIAGIIQMLDVCGATRRCA